MSERKKKAHAAEQQSTEMQREMTRKEERLRQRDRERHRKLYMFTGIALGAALLFIVVGVVYQFLILPNQQVARVGDVSIAANQFWKRAKLEKSNLTSQLLRYQQLEDQFGGQGFFTSQISQLQATLGSPFALGQQTLNQMLEELIIAREAAARGITVSDEELNQALRDEIANSYGLVTEPQATATAQGWIDATATAESWTPTPSPTAALTESAALTETASLTQTAATTETAPVTDTAAVTATTTVTSAETAAAPVVEAAATPTEEPTPLPTPVIITETLYSEGLTNLQNNINQVSGISLDEYKAIVRARLLREKLQEVIASEAVTTTTEEAVHARHILLRVREPEPTPTPLPDGAPTPEPTLTPTPLPDGAPTPTPTPGPRNDAETLALANELRQRLLAGEDFATLAAEYSDDTGSAVNGGDLGWFGRGQMVAPFEEAAFSLPLNEISEPVKTDFGYHLIEVLERDNQRPKDQAQLDQERALAFDTWLREQLASDQIQRTDNLANLLPPGL